MMNRCLAVALSAGLFMAGLSALVWSSTQPLRPVVAGVGLMVGVGLACVGLSALFACLCPEPGGRREH